MRDQRETFRDAIRNPSDRNLSDSRTAPSQPVETQPLTLASEPTFAVPDVVASDLDEDVIRRELQPGEVMLWNGRGTHFRMGVTAIPAVLFGTFFAGFAIFWIAMATVMGGKQGGAIGIFQIIFPLFGVPFLLVGLGVMASPFWAKRRAKNTLYALTNRRAIILEAAWFGSSRTVHSYEPSGLGAMTRVEHQDRSGDLVFERKITGTQKNGRPITKKVGFIGVPNVREVETAVRDALLAPGAGE
jgi:hypothetical protein